MMSTYSTFTSFNFIIFAVNVYSSKLDTNFWSLDATTFPIFHQVYLEELELEPPSYPNFAPFQFSCHKSPEVISKMLGSATAQMLNPSCIQQFSPEMIRALLNSHKIDIAGKSHIFHHAKLNNVEDFKYVIQKIYKNDLDWASTPGIFAILNSTQTQLGDGRTLLTIVNKWNKDELIDYALYSLAQGMNYKFAEMLQKLQKAPFEIFLSKAILPKIDCTDSQRKPLCAFMVQKSIDAYGENFRSWPYSVRSRFEHLLPVMPTKLLRNYGRKQFISLMKTSSSYSLDVTQSLAVLEEAFGDWMETPDREIFLPNSKKLGHYVSHTQIRKWFQQKSSLDKQSSDKVVVELQNLLKYRPSLTVLKEFESLLIGNEINGERQEELKTVVSLLSFEEMKVFANFKPRELQNVNVQLLSDGQNMLIGKYLTEQLSSNNEIVIKENQLEQLANFIGQLPADKIQFETTICAKLNIINSIAHSLTTAHKLLILEACPHAKFVEYGSQLLDSMNTANLSARSSNFKLFDLNFDKINGFTKTGSSENVVDMELSHSLSRVVFGKFRSHLGTIKITGQIARSLKKLIRGFAPSDIQRLNPFYFFDVIFAYLDQNKKQSRKMTQVVARKVRDVWWVLHNSEFKVGHLSDLQIVSLTGEVFREFTFDEFRFPDPSKCKDVFMKIGQTNMDNYSFLSNKIFSELYLKECKRCKQVEHCDIHAEDIFILGKLFCYLPAKVLAQIPPITLQNNLDYIQNCKFNKSQGSIIRRTFADVAKVTFDQFSSVRNSLCTLYSVEELGAFLEQSLNRYDRSEIWHLLALELENKNNFGDINQLGICVSKIREMVFTRLRLQNFKSPCVGSSSRYDFIPLIPVETLTSRDINMMSDCQFYRHLEYLSTKSDSFTNQTKLSIFKRVSSDKSLRHFEPEELLRIKNFLPEMLSPSNMSLLNFTNGNTVTKLSYADWSKSQLSAAFMHYMTVNGIKTNELNLLQVKILGRFICGLPENDIVKLQSEIFTSDIIFEDMICPDNSLIANFQRFFSRPDEEKLAMRPSLILGLSSLDRITEDTFSIIPDSVFRHLSSGQLKTISNLTFLSPPQAHHYQHVMKNEMDYNFLEMTDPFLQSTNFYWPNQYINWTNPLLLSFIPDPETESPNGATTNASDSTSSDTDSGLFDHDSIQSSYLVYILVDSNEKTIVNLYLFFTTTLLSLAINNFSV